MHFSEGSPAKAQKPTHGRTHADTIDKEVIAKANCTRQEYFEAVKILIDEGLCFNQKGGIVYDNEGKVVLIDEERVDPNTLELKNS